MVEDFRAAILVQSPDQLPLPNMNGTNIGDTTRYLRLALQQVKTKAEAFMLSIRELKTTHTQSSTTLKSAPVSSYILARPKKDTSTQIPNFVVSDRQTIRRKTIYRPVVLVTCVLNK